MPIVFYICRLLKQVMMKQYFLFKSDIYLDFHKNIPIYNPYQQFALKIAVFSKRICCFLRFFTRLTDFKRSSGVSSSVTFLNSSFTN